MKEAGIRMDMTIDAEDLAMLMAVHEAKKKFEIDMKEFQSDRTRLDALVKEMK